MARRQDAAAGPPRRLVPGIARSIALNTVIPLFLYRLTKSYLSPSEVVALGVAALFPLGASVLDVAGSRRLDCHDRVDLRLRAPGESAGWPRSLAGRHLPK
jgi:hypothetical protein